MAFFFSFLLEVEMIRVLRRAILAAGLAVPAILFLTIPAQVSGLPWECAWEPGPEGYCCFCHGGEPPTDCSQSDAGGVYFCSSNFCPIEAEPCEQQG